MTKKRGNNEGSVFQRKSDKRWCAAITLENGKRRVFYGRTRDQAVDKLTDAMKTHRDGLPLPSDKANLGVFLSEWLENVVKPAVRPRTVQRYESILRLHLLPELGRLKLAKLTPLHIQRLMNGRLASGLSPRTVGQIRGVLSYALNQAVRWGLVNRNVATLVDNPRVVRSEVKAFDPEEARAFLQAVKGHRYEGIYTLALTLGLRQGELLGLRWVDIDLEDGRLRVCKSLSKLDKTLVEPKSDSARRTIKLTPGIITALHEQRARQLTHRLKAGQRWQERGLVFTTGIGTPVDYRTLIQEFHAVLERATLPRLRFHDLRHSCATLLLAQNVHPKVVMEILGHSQISLTLDTYSHVIPSLQEDAMTKMDLLLSEK